MASRLFKLFALDSPSMMQVRYKYRARGKPPSEARNLAQRIEEMEYKDPAVYYKVDIGFPVVRSTNAEMRKNMMKELLQRRRNREIEKLSMRNELTVDLDKVKEEWLKEYYPEHSYTIAKHCGIFDDLYGDGYFYPIVPLTIDFDYGHEELLARVHRGNIIQPSEAKNAPSVSYEADPKSLYTLLLTTPDCNLTDPNLEYCHWFIGNIPGSDIAKGEQIIDYMRPIPAKGIGFCRYVFVLYKQDKKIDYSEYKKEQPCLNLVERNWKTYDFMKKHQDYVTPAGLAFFQSEFDDSIKHFYYDTLKMQHPVFEYDFPAPVLKKQVWFPKKERFNAYMDRYRDPKQINKEWLLKSLKKEHPFKFPEPPLKYPNAHPFKGYIPSWLKIEMRKERLGIGRLHEYK